MKTLTILDVTQLRHKTNGGGQPWQGCLAGCTKATMLKPNTTARDDIDTSGIAMIHVEIGKDAQARTKKERTAALAIIEQIVALAESKKADIRKLWYCPRALRSEFHAFKLGDRKQAKAVEAWDDENAALVGMGFPGKGVAGTFVDLYTHESTHTTLAARAEHAMKQWASKKKPPIPIGCLRFLDTGRVMTLTEARAYIRVLYNLSPTGEVGIFDIMPDGTADDARTSPVVPLIETIAKEGITQ